MGGLQWCITERIAYYYINSVPAHSARFCYLLFVAAQFCFTATCHIWLKMIPPNIGGIYLTLPEIFAFGLLVFVLISLVNEFMATLDCGHSLLSLYLTYDCM